MIEGFMRTLVFDTGPIISLSMNSILWLLKDLKRKFGGEFMLPTEVRKELVDRPIETKKFKFEALQVLSLINKGVLQVIDQQQARQRADRLYSIANKIFWAKNKTITIVHKAEMEAVATALEFNADAVIIDERTTRVLIEDPYEVGRMLERKLHTQLRTDQRALEEFSRETKGLRVLRSTELVVMAFELGLLDQYLPPMRSPRKKLLESVLWGVKLNGCAISPQEIDFLVREETADERKIGS